MALKKSNESRRQASVLLYTPMKLNNTAVKVNYTYSEPCFFFFFFIATFQSGSTVNRYNILIVMDPMILLDDFPSLGNQLINDYNSILPDFHIACNSIVQSMLDDDTLLFAEQVRLRIRLMYLPSVAEE